MAKPSEKSLGMSAFLDHFSKQTYGVSRTEAIEGDTCVSCKQPAIEFEDELSRKEYSISGLCQSCQNAVFKPPEEDDEDTTGDEVESEWDDDDEIPF